MADMSTTPRSFHDKDFIFENYSDYPDEFCNLENENLFPRIKFPMLRKQINIANYIYSIIEPTLLLSSCIIIQRWESFQKFVRHHDQLPSTAGWLGSDLESDDEPKQSKEKDEVINQIKTVIPEIDFDPDMRLNSHSYAQTILLPSRSSDLIVLDYNFIRLLRNDNQQHSQKLATLFFLAVLLGHHLAHVLEFRFVYKDISHTEFPTAIDTNPEAGIDWETHTFGGRIYPICEMPYSLTNMHGICIKSNAKMMKVNESWIHQLFSEKYWTGATRPQLRPPNDIHARHALLGDEFTDEFLESIAIVKRRAFASTGCDVRMEMQGPRPRNIGWPLVKETNICSGKKVI